MNIEIKDEILNTSGQLDNSPRYSIRDNNGAIIFDNVQLEMKTPVTQEGTPINKKLFQDFYTNIMIDTKETVVDYVVEEDTPQIDIENLDLISDGGLYELVIIGGTDSSSDNVGIGLRINGVETGYYGRQYSSNSGSNRAYMNIGCGGTGGTTIAWFGFFNEKLRVTTIGSYGSAVPHFVNFTHNTISNINTMSFFLPDGSLSSGIKAGTQIKIFKRR